MRVKHAYQGDGRGGNTAATVGTQYGGPAPGTHGPWRWGQLVKGSALEKVMVHAARFFCLFLFSLFSRSRCGTCF